MALEAYHGGKVSYLRRRCKARAAWPQATARRPRAPPPRACTAATRRRHPRCCRRVHLCATTKIPLLHLQCNKDYRNALGLQFLHKIRVPMLNVKSSHRTKVGTFNARPGHKSAWFFTLNFISISVSHTSVILVSHLSEMTINLMCIAQLTAGIVIVLQQVAFKVFFFLSALYYVSAIVAIYLNRLALALSATSLTVP